MGGIAPAVKNNVDHQLFHFELDVKDYDKGPQFTSENVMRYIFFSILSNNLVYKYLEFLPRITLFLLILVNKQFFSLFFWI